MSKKNKQARRQPAPAGGGDVSRDGITTLGMKVIGVGVAVIILGFIVLSRADAMGTQLGGESIPFSDPGGVHHRGSGHLRP